MAFQIGEALSTDADLNPLPESRLNGSLQKGFMIYDDNLAPYYSSYLKDFTTVANWFPKQPQILTRKSEIKEYQLSIPKLGLLDKQVKIGENNLAKSLVQYGNQVLPGEIGNVVVLGHSTLPQLYNEDDYRTIFTFLSTLERGDKVKVTIEGFTYNYIVYEMFVVDPEETWILEETADTAVMTLVTCVPPGTYWKRLIVKARLQGI